MSVTLHSVKIHSSAEPHADTIVVSDQGTIAYVGSGEGAPEVDGPRFDLRGRFVAPGFIDIHVHGGNGVSFGRLETLEDDLRLYAAWVASTGVTGFLCTVAAPDTDLLIETVSAYARLFEGWDGLGARPLGLHLEGPFLSEVKKGAFSSPWLRTPALEEARRLLEAGRGWIRQVTLAPELPGAREVASLWCENDVVVSLGHTDADYETARAALRGEYAHVTHTFNAQRGFHHREPGALGAILTSDRVTAELIADTVHVRPGAMRLLVRCLGVDRVVLITDAIAATGLGDGEFELLGRVVTVEEGRATLPDGTIAGSTVTLDTCVRNVVQHVGVSLQDAVDMASLNPARVLGLDDTVGSLEVGKRADLVVIDECVNLSLAMVGGKIVYRDI